MLRDKKIEQKKTAIECKCLNLGCVFNSTFIYINIYLIIFPYCCAVHRYLRKNLYKKFYCARILLLWNKRNNLLS